MGERGRNASSRTVGRVKERKKGYHPALRSTLGESIAEVGRYDEFTFADLARTPQKTPLEGIRNDTISLRVKGQELKLLIQLELLKGGRNYKGVGVLEPGVQAFSLYETS